MTVDYSKTKIRWLIQDGYNKNKIADERGSNKKQKLIIHLSSSYGLNYLLILILTLYCIIIH